MTLLTGTAPYGTYYVDIDKSSWTDCKSYYFLFGSVRLPEDSCYTYSTYGTQPFSLLVILTLALLPEGFLRHVLQISMKSAHVLSPVPGYDPNIRT